MQKYPKIASFTTSDPTQRRFDLTVCAPVEPDQSPPS
jgi:hypothetical protein